MKLIFTHPEEKKYLKEAFAFYLKNNRSLAIEWENWINEFVKIISESTPDTFIIEIPDSRDYEEAIYSHIMFPYVKEPRIDKEDQRVLFLNGFTYVNKKRFLI